MHPSKFLKLSLLSLSLLAAGVSSASTSYHVVIPVPGKTFNVSGIAVNLASLAQLPDGKVGAEYPGYDLKQLLTVTGDPSYTGYGVKWTLVSGSLPAGLKLNADGTIGGVPTVGGQARFTVSASYKTKSGEQAYQVFVSQVTVALSAGTPPAGVVGTAYSYDLNAHLTVSGDSGAPAAAGWSLVSGTLPAGLTLRPDGVISGTPTAAGSGTVRARATYKNASGEQSYQVVTLNITVTLDQAQLPAARVNTPYVGYDFRANLKVDGDPAYTSSQVAFSATGLPDGLALSPAGQLTGQAKTKTAGAQFDVVASYKNKTGQQKYTLVVKGLYLEATQISAGSAHTCAVTAAGAAKCWGSNAFGQLGNGSTTQSEVPVDVIGLQSGVASISAGTDFTCATLTSGAAMCWGLGAGGQLGNGSQANSSVPVSVSGMSSGVSTLFAGDGAACAVQAGAAKCWGLNGEGQLGNNNLVNSPLPVSVAGLTAGVSSLVGGQYFACAVTTAGAAKCWGFNQFGQLGNGTTTASRVPVDVSGLASGVRSMAAGRQHACALMSSSEVKCWGDNSYGQLGMGQAVKSPSPTNVQGATSVTELTAGYQHNCVRGTGSGIWCWGNGSSGQLGNGSTSGSLALVQVSGLPSTSTRVEAGMYHTCATTTTHSVCWGMGAQGRLGTGASVNQSSPTGVSD